MVRWTCRFLLLIHFTLSVYAFSAGLYVDNGIRQTVQVAELSNSHKKAVKQQILDLLGLQKRPKPKNTNSESAPHFMLELWRILQEEEGDDEDDQSNMERSLRRRRMTLPGMEADIGRADIITGFVNRAHRGKEGVRHKGNQRFYFDMSEANHDNDLTGAELRVYKERTGYDSTARVDIYRLKPATEEGGNELEFETSMTLEGDQSGWLEFNVTHAAQIWHRSHENNMGLYMIISDENGDDVDHRRVGLVTSRHSQDRQPFMVGFFKAGSHSGLHSSRQRRSPSGGVSYKDEAPPYYGSPQFGFPPPHERLASRSCQKRTLYVDFKDLNWKEWIIAPEGYSAYYCHGECSFPLNMHMNATNHAIVQTLVHLMNPSKVPKPGCAPTKLTALSVLYFDDNSNVILKKYRNMVAKACGCH